MTQWTPQGADRPVRIHRRAVALTSLAVTAVLAAGCGGGSASTASTDDRATATATATRSTAPASPRDVLLASVPEDSTKSLRYSVTHPNFSLRGTIDKSARTVTVQTQITDPELGFVTELRLLAVDQKLWASIVFLHAENLTGLPDLPKGWLRVDPAKVSSLRDVVLGYEDADPGEAEVVLKAVTAARRTGPGSYSGTIDLAKAVDSALYESAEGKPDVGKLGAKAQAVAFTARLDSAGRLVELTSTVPSIGKGPAVSYTLTYADYDSVPKVGPPPASQTRDATPEVYKVLNADSSS